MTDAEKYSTMLDKWAKRRAKIIEMVRQGNTLTMVGAKYGISRQRVKQIMVKEDG